MTGIFIIEYEELAKKTLRRFLTLSLSLVLFFCSISAGQEIGNIEKVYFAEEAYWPPFTETRFGKATEGLALHLMQEIFGRIGIEVEVELLPQKRMLAYIQSGRKDGATVISKNKERLKYMDYTDSIFQKTGYLYFLAERKQPIEWNSYADLKGLRIGIVNGHNYGDDFNLALEKYLLVVYRLGQIKQGFDMLLVDRIDVLFCINHTANQFLRDSKYMGKVTHARKSYFSKGYHIGFSKKSKAKVLIPLINQVIKRMKQDGSLDRILSKYIY